MPGIDTGQTFGGNALPTARLSGIVTPDRTSFFLAGFECASHRQRDGRRVDSVRATGHDRLAAADYAAARAAGLHAARDGLRWHLIEAEPGRYDWSSWLPQLRAARAVGMRVIWDLWHYGTPDWLDIFGRDFPERLAAFAQAAAEVHAAECDGPPLWCPANEISFYAFIAGEVGDFSPYAFGRGPALKRQLARAAIAAARAVRGVDPAARLLWAEPAIHVVPRSGDVADVQAAERAHKAQFEAWDMVAGRLDPDLGGSPDLLDLVGLNYYPQNQWVLEGGVVALGSHLYRPFSSLIADIHARYGRPMLVAETGAEGSARAPWLHYVCQEVAEAHRLGLPVEGVCLYPVTDYPGWDDGRICPTGLFGMPDDNGRRTPYAPLRQELERQQALLGPTTSAVRPSASSAASAMGAAPVSAFRRPSPSGQG
jgi:hypothetical protein